MAPGSPRPVSAVLAEFAEIVGREHDARDILQAVGDYCTELLPVDAIGVLLSSEDGLVVATANSQVGEVVEQLEAELGEGPCTRAIDTGEQVRCPELSKVEEHYPRFVPAAMDAGVRAIHALPMASRTHAVGALDVISTTPGPLSPDELATAQLLADVTVAYMQNSQTLEERSALASQLQHALDSRVVIEQAKGVLAERHHQTPTEAFERLRRHARTNRQAVREVAEAVLEGRLQV